MPQYLSRAFVVVLVSICFPLFFIKLLLVGVVNRLFTSLAFC